MRVGGKLRVTERREVVCLRSAFSAIVYYDGWGTY